MSEVQSNNPQSNESKCQVDGAEKGYPESVEIDLDAEKTCIKSIVLDHYHCTFFLPIITDQANPFPVIPLDQYKHTYNNAEKTITDQEQQADAQAYHFFTPSIRNILFDQGKEDDELILEPMREWRLPKEIIRHWQLMLHKNSWAEGEETDPLNQQQAVFESVKLYRYFNNNYLLAFRVAPKALHELHHLRDNELTRIQQLPEHQEKSDGECLGIANERFTLFQSENALQYLNDYQDDPFSEKYQYLQLEAWLRFSRLARQLYPSFTEQGEEGKIAKLSLDKGNGEPPIDSFDERMSPDFPEHIGEQLSPIVKDILLAFFKPKHHEDIKHWLKQSLNLYDDRMFISVAYGLAGKKHDKRTLSIINTLAGTTDRVDDSWKDFDNLPYSPEAMRQYLAGSQFGFWKDKGGVYSYTDMVNAYVSNSREFREMIAPIHIPAIYDRMLVQALFYQTSLRYYDHAITLKTSLLVDSTANKTPNNVALDMTQLLGDFIRFTNQYWFADVTNQMQGKEIFKHQLKGLNVDKHFSQLQDEINRTTDYVHAEYGRRETEKDTKLVWFGLLIAGIALLPVFNDVFKPEASLWSGLARYLGEIPPPANQLVEHVFSNVRIGIAAMIALLVLFGGAAIKWFLPLGKREK